MQLNSGKFLIIIPGLILIVVLSFCSKGDVADDGWKDCFECTTEAWIGEFTVANNYSNYTYHSNTNGITISIVIEEIAPKYLLVYFEAPNYFSATISRCLASNFIISYAESGLSITTALDIGGQDLRLYGTTNKFRNVADSAVIDELINFEVYKIS
jgi:hypothetical protein